MRTDYPTVINAPVRTNVSAVTRVWNNPRAIWGAALVPHAIAIFYSARSIALGHPPGNLVDFLGAAREMLRGGDIYAGGTGGYVYPPLIAFLYQPLALLPERMASFLSLGINAALSIFTLALIARVLVRRLTGLSDPHLVARVALLGAFLSADKIRGEFYHVETNVFMLLAFTAAMRWVDRRPWLCGLALGFGFNVKYWPVVLVPYLCCRRRWRAVGWFAGFAVAFALVPSLTMGLSANAYAWAQAAGGLSSLFGFDTGMRAAAKLRPITDNVSLSLTSGIARVTHCSPSASLAIAAVIGVVFCGYAVALYRRHRVPLLAWPAVADQSGPPWRGLLTIEWMGLLLLMLIFSPFTNSRHLYMLLDVNVAAAVLFLAARNLVPRTPLAVATVIMSLSTLIGRSTGPWHRIGGPGWCMLAMYAALLWTNVQYQRATAPSLILDAAEP